MRLPFLFVTSALLAQPAPPLEVQRFLKNLKESRSGTFVFLEDAKGERRRAVAQLAEDEGLVAEGVELRWWAVNASKASEASIAAYLARRYGWDQGPHWAYVDPAGEILFQGEALPTAQGLREGLRGAGVRSAQEVLEAFVEAHPEQVEARGRLLEALARVATRRTERLYPRRKSAESEGEEAAPAAEPPQLDEALDTRIWGRCRAQMQKYFQVEGWAAADSMATLWIEYLRAARHSPLMKEMATRCLPLAEAQLQRTPASINVWRIWLRLATVAGGRPLGPLLDSLSPDPQGRSEQWPPLMALAAYVKEARSRGDWAGIQQVLEPRWEAIRLEERYEKGAVPDEGYLWDFTLGPLVEAHLRRGNGWEADRIVGEAVTRLGLKSAAAKAQALALRCKQPTFAARWKALVTP